MYFEVCIFCVCVSRFMVLVKALSHRGTNMVPHVEGPRACSCNGWRGAVVGEAVVSRGEGVLQRKVASG